MKRREFTRWMTAGTIASSLPVAIAACTNNQSNQTLPVSELPAAGGATVSALDRAGFISITVDGKPTTVVRNPAQANEIVAVNQMCTHKGCTVAWKADQKAFVCPCHGAKFDATGQVINPPADKPLQRYQVKVNGDQIMVEV